MKSRELWSQAFYGSTDPFHQITILRRMLREVVVEYLEKIDSCGKSQEGAITVRLQVPNVFEPDAPVVIEHILFYCYVLIEEGRRREYEGEHAAEQLFLDLCKWHLGVELEVKNIHGGQA